MLFNDVVATSERMGRDSSQTRIVLGDLVKRSPSIQVWEGVHEEEFAADLGNRVHDNICVAMWWCTEADAANQT